MYLKQMHQILLFVSMIFMVIGCNNESSDTPTSSNNPIVNNNTQNDDNLDTEKDSNTNPNTDNCPETNTTINCNSLIDKKIIIWTDKNHNGDITGEDKLGELVPYSSASVPQWPSIDFSYTGLQRRYETHFYFFKGDNGVISFKFENNYYPNLTWHIATGKNNSDDPLDVTPLDNLSGKSMIENLIINENTGPSSDYRREYVMVFSNPPSRMSLPGAIIRPLIGENVLISIRFAYNKENNPLIISDDINKDPQFNFYSADGNHIKAKGATPPTSQNVQTLPGHLSFIIGLSPKINE